MCSDCYNKLFGPNSFSYTTSNDPKECPKQGCTMMLVKTDFLDKPKEEYLLEMDLKSRKEVLTIYNM